MFSLSLVKMHFPKQIGSTNSVHLRSDKSLKAFNRFYHKSLLVNLKWKHFKVMAPDFGYLSRRSGRGYRNYHKIFKKSCKDKTLQGRSLEM